MRKLIFFLLFYSLIFRECSASLQPIKDHSKNLPQFICDAAEEVSKQELRTMAIVKLRHNFPSSFFDELHKCMPIDVAMVQLNLESAFVDVEVKNVKFVAVIGDDVEGAKFINLVDDQNSKRLLSHLAKFLFVSTSKQKMMKNLSKVLPKNGILDFAAAFEDENEEVNVEVSNHFTNTSKVLKNIPKSEIISRLYPNKLENMHKAPIRVLAHQLMPEVEIVHERAISIHAHFFETIAERKNATVEMKIGKSSSPLEFIEKITAVYNKQEVDTSLSSLPQIFGLFTQIFSFTEDGICAMIPLSPPKPYYLSALTAIFGRGIVFCMVISVAAYMIIWRIYVARGEAFGSSWNIPFGIQALLHGQGFNFRTISYTMKLLLMVYIYGVFVMSNFYQASLTTLVTQPMPQHHISTLGELFSGEMNLTVQMYANQVISFIPEYQNAVEAGKVTTVYGTDFVNLENIQIFSCKVIEKHIRLSGYENFYMYPHRLVTFYTYHEMGFMNPYKENFQDLVIQTYSAGLNKAWKTFSELEEFGPRGIQKTENNFELLKFEDVLPLFWILPIGFISSLLVLLLEIFYHDFLSQLSKELLRRKFYAMIEKRKKKTHVRVRRIQVQPINESEM